MRTITLTVTGSSAQVIALADGATAEETRAAIQGALDLASASALGGKVELSAGIYTVTPGTDAGDGALRIGSNTEFAGAGLGQTIVRLAGDPGHNVTGIVRTASGKTASDGSVIATHDVVVRDLTIDGNNANTGSAEVDGFYCGPRPFTDTAFDSNIRLESVEVCNVSRYGFDPHERTDNLTFVACIARDNGIDGFTIDHCDTVSLIDCEAYGNGRHGVNVVTGSSGVTITGLDAHDNGGTGLTIQTGNDETRALTSGVTITASTINNNGGDGISVREAEGVTIGGTLDYDGVTIFGNGRFGILVEGGTGVMVTGALLFGNAGGTGSDSTQIRVRGYAQTHLDSDPLNDVFVPSSNIVIAANTIGQPGGDALDYAVSYSDADNIRIENNTVFAFIAPSIQDASKAGTLPASTTHITDGDDTVTGTAGADTITGESGNDAISGGEGNDKIYGADGNDMLDGGAGADTLTGGYGDDIYIADSFDFIVEAAKAGTDEVRTRDNVLSIAAAANVEKLTFAGTGNFTGTGNGAVNVITGGLGHDYLDGGAGADTLIGGAGNDTYCIDASGDTLSDIGGFDTVRASFSYTLREGYENLVLTGPGLTGTGNGADNELTGGTGSDHLIGGAGNDRLDGGAGRDELDGGSGNDVFLMDHMFDRATGGDGIDTVLATVYVALGLDVENLTLTGADNIDGTGNAAANVLRGNAGANTLEGLGGNDVLDGGSGSDRLYGGDGNDSYFVDRSDDTAFDSGGIDRVTANASYTLGSGLEHLILAGVRALDGTGNTLANTMLGNGAANKLSGLKGNDVLSGGAGADTLFGGLGRDVLTGGTGADRFVFDTAANTVSNSDRTIDFSVADDTIVLARSSFSAFTRAGGILAGQFVRGTAAADSNDLLIYNATTGTLSYDANGKAAGGQAVIATLSKGLALTHADFLIV